MSTRKGVLTSGLAGLFLAVFSLSFSAVGGLMTYLTAHMLIDHYRMRGWVETPARIVDLALDRHAGDESTTYSVRCTYEYTFNGKRYRSARVGLTGGRDNVGSWHQDTFNRLRADQEAGRPVRCFVNPARPTQAVLDRDIRYAVLVFYTIAVLAFGGVGLGMLAATGFFAAERLRKRRTRLGEPGKPWLENPQWAAGVVSAKLKSKAAVAWCAAGYWNAATLPTVLFLPGEVASRQNYLALIALILPLAGLGLLIYAVRATSRVRRFGGSRFELETIPGAIGGRLGGRLVLAGDVAAIDEVEVTLKCVHTYTTSSGGKSSTSIHTIWEQAQTHRAAGVTFGQTELSVPVDFAIPASCRPTDESDSSDKIKWKLDVRAAVPGVDLKMSFEVPVFRMDVGPRSPAAAAGENDARPRWTDA